VQEKQIRSRLINHVPLISYFWDDVRGYSAALISKVSKER